MNASTGKLESPRWSGLFDRQAAWVAVAALLMTAGLPPLVYLGWLVPLAMAIFFKQLADSSRPGRLAWLFGMVHQLTLLHWLFLLVPAKTIPTRALVPIQAILTVVYVSVFYLLLGWAFGRIRRLTGPRRALFLLPVLWTGAEALRAWGEMGFPWCLSGSAAIGGPLMGLARASGEIGLSAGFAFLAAVLAALWIRRQGGERRAAVRWLLGATVVVWVWLGVGSVLRPESPRPDRSDLSSAADSTATRTRPIRIAAIQANVSLADKWIDAKIDSTKIPYGDYTRLAAAQGAEFVVWAETALPAYVRIEKPLLNWTRHLVRETGVYLFTGFPDAERRASGELFKFNSSGLFSPDGTLVDQYAKHHLLPIGEAMPFTSLIPSLAKIDVGQAEWSPGPEPMPLTLKTGSGEFSFACLICFESVFSRLARIPVAEGAQALAVITNDGWFGDSAGPRQHTALARLRAVECNVPVIRCANNGISFICDADGRILDSLTVGRRGLVSADVVPGTGRTVYVRYGAWPLMWLLLLWSAVVLAWPIVARRCTGGGPTGGVSP